MCCGVITSTTKTVFHSIPAATFIFGRVNVNPSSRRPRRFQPANFAAVRFLTTFRRDKQPERPPGRTPSAWAGCRRDKKRSKILSCWSNGMPTPSSLTMISMLSSALRTVTETVPPSLANISPAFPKRCCRTYLDLRSIGADLKRFGRFQKKRVLCFSFLAYFVDESSRIRCARFKCQGMHAEAFVFDSRDRE